MKRYEADSNVDCRGSLRTYPSCSASVLGRAAATNRRSSGGGASYVLSVRDHFATTRDAASPSI